MRRRRRHRRRWLPRHVDGVAPPRARAGAGRRAARGGASAAMARAGGTAGSARRCGATRPRFARRRETPRRSPSAGRPRRPCAASARGASENDVDAWFREAPMLRSRRRSRSWGPGRARGTRSRRARRRRGGRLGVGRRGAGALRVAALPRRRALPPERNGASRPDSHSASGRSCSSEACAIHERTAATRLLESRRRGDPHRAGRGRIATSSRSTPPQRRFPAIGSRSPSPRATSSSPSRCPDVVDELGWTGGEAIVDSRTLVHYMRTTQDGRIVFGWGGGTMGIARPRRPTASSSIGTSSPRPSERSAASSRRRAAAR